MIPEVLLCDLQQEAPNDMPDGHNAKIHGLFLRLWTLFGYVMAPTI